MPTLNIRLANPDDALGIATVQVKTWQVAYKGLLPDSLLDGLSIERRATRWGEILRAPMPVSLNFVAEDSTRIIGFSSAGASRDKDVDAHTGELYALYVDTTHMQHGVGTALINAAMDYLRSQLFTHAVLWVLENNDHARRFYEQRGWTADGEHKTEEKDGVPLPQVRYTITL